jgi:hypothetical protein
MANVPAVVIKTPSAGPELENFECKKSREVQDSDQVAEDVVDHVAAEGWRDRGLRQSIQIAVPLQSMSSDTDKRAAPSPALGGHELVNNLVDDM